MFRAAWDAKAAQFKDAKSSIQQQINEAEKQIDSLLTRIVNATNEMVIGAYEKKISALEKSKVRLRGSLFYQ